MSDADARPGLTPFGGTLALGVAAVAGLGLGAGLGVGPATALAMAGVGLFLAAGVGVQRDPRRVVAAASIAVPLGVGAVAVGAWLAGGNRAALVALAAVAVLAVGLDTKTALFRTTDHSLGRTIRQSALAFALVAVPIAVGLAAGDALIRVAVSGYDAATGSRFGALVVLQAEALLVARLLGPATSAVASWARGHPGIVRVARTDIAPIASVATPARRYYYVLFGVQAVLAAFAPGTLNVALSALPGVGPAVATVLDLRLLHRPLEALLLALVAIVALEECRSIAASWAEPDPGRTAARAAGGFVIAGALALAGALPWTAGAVAGAVPLSGRVHPIAVLVVPLVLGYVALFVLAWAANPPMPLPRGVGVTAGAAALFACALGGALAGAGTPLAVGVAAAAFVVHDTGSTAARLGATVGTDADTARGEFVRAGVSVAVGLGAVVLATAARYGSIAVSVPRWRAYLALALALVALFAFALSMARTAPLE